MKNHSRPRAQVLCAEEVGWPSVNRLCWGQHLFLRGLLPGQETLAEFLAGLLLLSWHPGFLYAEILSSLHRPFTFPEGIQSDELRLCDLSSSVSASPHCGCSVAPGLQRDGGGLPGPTPSESLTCGLVLTPWLLLPRASSPNSKQEKGTGLRIKGKAHMLRWCV